MTAEEYRQRMIQAFHNTDCDELISVCVLPTEKEFNHLEWLLKNHYKKELCEDAISRAEAIRVASGHCHWTNIPDELAKLPSVTQTPKEVNDVLDAIKADLQTLADDEWNQQVMASKGLEFAIEIIENYQMAMMEGVEE